MITTINKCPYVNIAKNDSKDTIFLRRNGCYYCLSSKDYRKLYNPFDISKIFSDGEELIFYRLTKYLSPETNILCEKAYSFKPMDFNGIMKATNRGTSTIRRFLDKACKNHIIAIFTKSYDKKVYQMYGVNPFIACAGNGKINVFLYQMWTNECKKYLRPDDLMRLERMSGYLANYEPFQIKNGKLCEYKLPVFKNKSILVGDKNAKP